MSDETKTPPAEPAKPALIPLSSLALKDVSAALGGKRFRTAKGMSLFADYQSRVFVVKTKGTLYELPFESADSWVRQPPPKKK